MTTREDIEIRKTIKFYETYIDVCNFPYPLKSQYKKVDDFTNNARMIMNDEQGFNEYLSHPKLHKKTAEPLHWTARMAPMEPKLNPLHIGAKHEGNKN